MQATQRHGRSGGLWRPEAAREACNRLAVDSCAAAGFTWALLQVLKRPGVEAFLLEMGRRYEVVIYTDEAAMYADPVINKIDPHRAVTYRLYRGDTQVGWQRAHAATSAGVWHRDGLCISTGWEW